MKMFVHLGSSVEQVDLIEKSYESQFGKSLKAEIKGKWAATLSGRCFCASSLRSMHNAGAALPWMALAQMRISSHVLGGAEKDMLMKIHKRYDEK